MNSNLESISLSVPSLDHPLDVMGGSNGESGGCMNPGAGTFWQNPSICKNANPGVISSPSDSGTLLTTGKCKNRVVQVAYVKNSETSQPLSPENMALQCLKDACDVVVFKLDIIPFGKLDFGETSVLDHFYNAGKSTDIRFGECPANECEYHLLNGHKYCCEQFVDNPHACGHGLYCLLGEFVLPGFFLWSVFLLKVLRMR